MPPLRSRLAQRGATGFRSLPLSGAATLALSLFALTPAGAAAAPAGPTFSIVPVTGTRGYVVVEARPGARVRRTLRVTNTGDRPGPVKLYAVDATTGVTSGAVYRGEHAPRRDVGSWIDLSEARVRLAPGASRDIDVTVHVPSDARAGQHLGGVVAEGQTITRGRSVRRGHGTLKVDVRLLTVDAVQVDVPGPRRPHVSLTSAEPGGTNGHQAVKVGIDDDGTELVKPRGTFVLSDSSGRVLMRRRLRLDTLVPDTTIGYPVEVTGHALPAGDYEVAVVLRYRGGLARRTLPLSISDENVKQVFRSHPDLAPPPQSGLATALLLGAAGLAAGLALAAAAAQLRRRRAAR